MNNNFHNKTPLFNALKNYVNKKTIPFHVPGHKQGAGIETEFKHFLGNNIFKIDLTSFDEVDNLHKPTGVIKEAQDLASKLYRSDATFFSINGTSCAIQAMIMSVVKEGEKILLPRNIHKSITSALILTGAIPIYIQPDLDFNLGIAHGVSSHSIDIALKHNNDIKAVLIINPTYYGISSNIEKIVNIVHSYNIPLIVDEAHGAHLTFSDKLPPSALDAGADMCAQSTHKILGSMTQSSMLHVKSKLIKSKKVQQILNILQTTSPSYILMSSLDICRKQMALQGKELIEYAVILSNYARKEINKIPGLYCFGEEILNKSGTYALDPTKLTICCKELHITGYELYSILSQKYNIQLELADFYNVLAICTYGDNFKSITNLITALTSISKELYMKSNSTIVTLNIPPISKQILTPRQAFFSKKYSYPINESVNNISGESLIPYPPGIPILCPGELITKEIINYVSYLNKANISILGTKDLTLNNIKVIKKE